MHILPKNDTVIKTKKGENKYMEQPKKKFTILGYSIWKILAYFILYSVAGYIIETIFGIMTKGMWESRQSFLYGPFCAIYGLGAVIMIVFLQYFTKSNTTLFLGGFIIGSITEYMVSLIGEWLFGIKWWDYSNMPLNLQGRICVFFSLFWGFLAIFLMGSVQPKMNQLIDHIAKKVKNMKWLKRATAILILFLAFDFGITCYALKMFYVRMIVKNDIQVENKEQVVAYYHQIYDDEKTSELIYKFWGDRKMIRTFPNLKVEDKNGTMIYFDSLLPDIQPYYVKVWDKKFN